MPRDHKQNHSNSKVKWIGISAISVKQHSSKLTASGGTINSIIATQRQNSAMLRFNIRYQSNNVCQRGKTSATLS